MKMKYNDSRTEILLALSVASDEMMRVVHVFSEVGYMDVMSNTNKEGHNLHLLVVNDAHGETVIVCVALVTAQQRWVFKRNSTSFGCYLVTSPCLDSDLCSLTTICQSMVHLTRASKLAPAIKTLSSCFVYFAGWL